MKQVDRVFLGMELKVVAPSLMWKEAVLVVQYIMSRIICLCNSLHILACCSGDNDM